MNYQEKYNHRTLKKVKPHMSKTPLGFQLDVEHRYFTEDIPYGLMLIKSVAKYVGVPTPNIDMVLSWAQKVMGTEFRYINARSMKSIISFN